MSGKRNSKNVAIWILNTQFDDAMSMLENEDYIDFRKDEFIKLAKWNVTTDY